jgi:plasmid stabilization system protein ParE
MRRPYRLSKEARVDLLSLWTYIAQDNPRAADRVVAKLDRAVRLLAQFPNKGHRRADIHTSEPVLFWTEDAYVIVYRPTPRPLLIVRVIHGARDLDALL